MADEFDEYNARRKALRTRNFAIGGIIACLVLLVGIFLVGKFFKDAAPLAAMGEPTEEVEVEEATIEPLPLLDYYNMSVDSEPPGAAIVVNGIATGLETPATVEAVQEAGNTIVLIKDGYETLVHNADANAESVSVQLKEYTPEVNKGKFEEAGLEGPLRGKLRVISRSPGGVFDGAEVRLNGVPQQEVTPVDFDVQPNQLQHITVRDVEHLDGVMFVQAIPFYQDEDRRDALVEMQKKRDNAYSAVAIRTFPRNARVYMDDEDITGDIITPVAMNRHFTIRAEAVGHDSFEQHFDAVVGTIDLSIMLEQPVYPDGTIAVEGGPDESTLYLVPQREGKESSMQIGRNGTAVKRTVESGPYILRVAYGPQNKRQKTDLEIEIPEDGHLGLTLGTTDGEITILRTKNR